MNVITSSLFERFARAFDASRTIPPSRGAGGCRRIADNHQREGRFARLEQHPPSPPQGGNQIKHAHCFLLLFMLQALFACGPYSFSSSGNSGLKTVAVPVFNDQTAEFGVKEQLTNAVITAFTRDNNLKIADRRAADAIVNGTLLRVTEQAGVYTRSEQVQEIRVTLTVQIKYEDVKKRKVLWEETLMQFGAYSPGDATSGDRESAIKQAVDKIAAEVLNKSVSDW